MLEDLGVEVCSVWNGEEALEKLAVDAINPAPESNGR